MKGGVAVLLLELFTSAAAYKATTTRYYDGQKGACGCGSGSGLFSWQLGIGNGVYTAAGSQALYDTAGANWCGAGCGKCYKLTSTGAPPCTDCGTGGVAGKSIIVMVTNLCPYNGNQQWCPNPGATNQYGYSYHFDIMAQNEIFGDNVVVDFEPIACPGQATTDWQSCGCYGQTETDTTPVGLESGGGGSGGSSQSSTTTLQQSTTTRTTLTPTTTSGSGSGSSGGAQSVYGQCGGSGWTGPTNCASGSTCKAQNQWYSQCLP
ncbi:Endoglucanase-5 [Penicillium diatomitis]|uniref:Cellulase n=1 Tax=Penicillium diatomitis TaxID=2819901 RepID=A0A9X0BXP0_9EURO|nr:Endoglucanase-5 [Penicillium diatomitis]KAJ5488533.1 Endoglucanase-5 [Penicillium diatomitis]